MTTIHHINCGTLQVRNYPTVVCHCLLLQDGGQVALIDTGIGLADVRDPVGRLGLVDDLGEASPAIAEPRVRSAP